MSYQTPPGWAQRCTMRDDTLPHQIRIFFHGNGNHLVVSCACRRKGWKGNNQGGPALEPLAEITDLEQAWAAYRAHLPADAGEAAS